LVTITIFQPLAHDEVDFLASATVLRGKLDTEGPRADLIDTERRVFSSRRNGFLTIEDDPEEWLRSFAEGFRSAQVVAAIIKDTNHKELMAPADLITRLQDAHAVA
jgi:hypothetical protein